MLDMASGYHMVKQIHGRKSTDLLADFTDCWMVLAGPPMKVTCDQERGFIKDFADGVEMVGSTVRFDAGQAHWQQGATEGTTSARTTFGPWSRRPRTTSARSMATHRPNGYLVRNLA